MTVAMALGGVLVVAGLVTTFAGVRVRGRLPGLAAMGAGAVVMLGAASPGGSGAGWTVLSVGVTLAGMVLFAAVLARHLDRVRPHPRALDPDRDGGPTDERLDERIDGGLDERIDGGLDGRRDEGRS